MTATRERLIPTASDQEGSIRAYTDVTSTSAISIRADWLRTNVDLLSDDVRSLQDDTRATDLSSRAHAKATTSDVPALLEELADRRGMSWTDIAAAAHVSVSAIRKWRQGNSATAESRLALARIAAFLDVLLDKGVPDPAQWMEMPLPLPAGYSIRPIDLYSVDCAEGILDLVEPVDAASVLDRITPAWREQRSDFEVFTDTDGQRSIRLRDV